MDLPVREGLAVLHSIASEWMWRRDLLALLGAEDPDRLDTLLADTSAMSGSEGRAARIAAFAEATGGEISWQRSARPS